MIDQSTDSLGIPKPHPSNRLDEDVVRLRAALDLIDDLVASRASLGPDGKLLVSQLPSVAIVDYLGTVNSQASMLQLVGQKGDWCIRTDESRVWVVTGSNPASIGSWTAWAYPGGGVASVNGRSGAVTLTKSDFGLENVDNTSDLSKPISTAVAAALAGKQAAITGAASSIVETLLTAGRAVVSDGFGRVSASTVTGSELGYLTGVTGNLQTQLNLRVSKTADTGSALLPSGTTSQRDIAPLAGYLRYNTTTSNFEGYYGAGGWKTIGATISLANISDWPAAVSAAEVGYLDGVTGAIQTQLDGKAASGHTHAGVYQPLDADLTAIAALSGSTGYLRKTADNTWTIDAGGGGGGGGTVTSVGLTAPAALFAAVTGSPVTTAGTLGLALASQTANYLFAGPASGAAAAPTFRALVAGDIPDLSSVYQIVTAGLTSFNTLSAGSTKGVLWKNVSAHAWSLVTTLTNSHITAINSVPIGASGTSTGAFSTLSASSTVSGAGFTALFASPLPLGSTTPNTGAFSNLSYTGTLTGGTGIVNLGSGQFYKDASGRVGIGVSAPAPWSVTALAVAAKGSALFSSGAGQAGLAQGMYYNGGWKFSSGSKASRLELSNGDILTFTTSYAGSDGVATGDTAGPYVAAGGTTWTTGSSDARLKRDFAPVPGLDVVRQIEPVAYRFRWETDTAPRRLGFTAQNLRPLIPEMVVEKRELAEDGTPLLTITPDYILPVLVQAIQDLAAEVESLKTQWH